MKTLPRPVPCRAYMDPAPEQRNGASAPAASPPRIADVDGRWQKRGRHLGCRPTCSRGRRQTYKHLGKSMILGVAGACWGAAGEVLGPLGDVLAASWGLSGAFWVVLGASWGLLKVSWGVLVRLGGVRRRILRPLRHFLRVRGGEHCILRGSGWEGAGHPAS